MKYSIAILALSTLAANAAVTVSLPGNTETSNWALNSTNYPSADYNSFPTAANPWTAPAAPTTGTSSALLDKVGGSGYMSGGGFMYTAGASGSFSIYDDSPLAGLATIVFQGAISDPLVSAPVLNYNGGSQSLTADYSGEFTGAPYDDRVWQWNLSGVGNITEFEILFDGHFAATSFDLDTSDQFLQAVPEPSVLLLASLAPFAACLRRRRPLK